MKQGEKAEVPNYTRTGLTINGNRSEGVMNPNVKVVSVWTAVVRREIQQPMSTNVVRALS